MKFRISKCLSVGAAAAIAVTLGPLLHAQLTFNGQGTPSLGAGMVSATAEDVAEGGPFQFNSNSTGMQETASFTDGSVFGSSLASGGGTKQPFLGVAVNGTFPTFGNYETTAAVEYQFAVVLPNQEIETSVTLTATSTITLSQVGQDVDTMPGAIFPTASGGDTIYVSSTPTPSFSEPNTVDLFGKSISSLDLVADPSNVMAQESPGTETTPISTTFNVFTNAVYYVNLSAQLSGDGGAGNAEITLDPLLTLTSALPGAELIVSPGFNNNPALPPPPPLTGVPEPSTYGMMAVVALAMIVLGRRVFRIGIGGAV
jgi:hypothetical protein